MRHNEAVEGIDQGRRVFLRVSAAVGGGLLIGLRLPQGRGDAAEVSTSREFQPNAWVRIGADDQITVVVDKSEMGQGVATALPMLVAEELEVPLERVRFEFAPAARVYRNPDIGLQVTGGSTSVKTSWMPLRRAGASARLLLLQAAAWTWSVPVAQCRAESGGVVSIQDGRRLSYGALASTAARMPLPDEVPLKSPADFRLIGTRAARLDVAPKVQGTARFGIDVTLPGLLVAAIAHAPVLGARLKRLDAQKASSMNGVRQVVPLESAVAVVADSWWRARQALDAVEVEWDGGCHADLSSAAILATYRDKAQQQGRVARMKGEPERGLARAAKTVRAHYYLPYLAHATLEPMNCTAEVRPDSCTLWVPTQAQSGAQDVAARITGLRRDAVKVNTTYLGGGFGRRSEQDFVAEAVQLSKAVGAPVKLTWSREEDMRHDFYRPATYHVLEAGLDGGGEPLAWTHRVVGPSILARVIPAFAPAMLPQWVPNLLKSAAGDLASFFAGFTVDQTAVEGAKDLPYAIDNIRVDYVRHDPGVPVGFWRSVGHSYTAFVVECFIDEVAAAAGRDPYRFRRALLQDAPHHLAVLDLAAEQAGWDEPAPAGVHRGIAVHASFGSTVAQVAEVSVGDDGTVRVHRVVCAVDCGTVVNPAIVEAQMESAIVFGLTAALKGEITVAQGRVEQSNFNDYPLLRIDEMPAVEVHLVKSDAPPTGVGEPGTPPIAPAVANAVFAATGVRVRQLPISPDQLRRG